MTNATRARAPIYRCKKCGYFYAMAAGSWEHECPTTPNVIVDGTARKLALKTSRGKGG